MKTYHEQQEQMAVANYLRSLKKLFTINAYAGTSARTGAKLKASGYDDGCPDIMIYEPRFTKRVHEGENPALMMSFGLFIELKRSPIYGGHKVSKKQKEWVDRLQKKGYQAHVCVGAQEAYKVIDEYFGIGGNRG